jgi:uncharacterized membrane protein
MATDLTRQGLGRRRPGAADFPDAAPATSFMPRRGARALGLAEATEPLERGLGWFSIALGTAALAAPRTLCWLTGGRGPVLMRLVGARELSTGVGILRGGNRTPWLWSRVAGDVMDLALLSFALTRPHRRGRATVATAAVAGVAALDVLAALRSERAGESGRRAVGGASGKADIYVERSVAIGKSPEECYRFWRSFENLPRFMRSIESVQPLDERLSRWVAKGPASLRLEWTSEITTDRPGEELAWRSLEDSGAANSGSVRFEAAPSGRGTIVRVSLHYSPLGGALGAGLVKLLGRDPHSSIREDLRRFKQVMETGEVATTRGQPTGRRSMLGRAARQWGITS